METCDFDLLVFDEEVFEDFYDYHNSGILLMTCTRRNHSKK
jgi:hypothetical protein